MPTLNSTETNLLLYTLENGEKVVMTARELRTLRKATKTEVETEIAA